MVAKRLPPDVNRILLVKNLPFNITTDEIYDLFGKYGAIRQVRMSDSNDTKGRPRPHRASASSADLTVFCLVRCLFRCRVAHCFDCCLMLMHTNLHAVVLIVHRQRHCVCDLRRHL
jgi:hypothetical protein